MKRLILTVLIVSCLMSCVVFTVSAQSSVKVNIDGKEFSGGIIVKNGTTFVDVQSFAKQLDSSSYITFDSNTRVLYIRTDSLYLMCEIGKGYIIANERYLYNEQLAFIEKGIVYAPIMQIYKAFGASIKWSDSFGGFYVTAKYKGIEWGSSYYDNDCVYWLSRIINAEAQGEPLLGKIAVGNVVMNRIRSSSFPNTVYGVIFDRKYGVQFTPVATGTIHNTPNEESIIAAKICLEYYSINNDILYFVNPDIAPNSWASRNRQFYGKIGNHEFYI